MHVLIPFKGFRGGKSRLSQVLDDEARCTLCKELLFHAIAVASVIVPVDLVNLVTPDRRAAAFAKELSVSVLHEASETLNGSLDSARTQLLKMGARELLILPVDLPWASGPALQLAAAKDGDVVIAADEGGEGTNLLILRDAGVHLPFSFGPGSSAAHFHAAVSRGLKAIYFRDKRLAFDLDTPDHYSRWLKAGGWTKHENCSLQL